MENYDKIILQSLNNIHQILIYEKNSDIFTLYINTNKYPRQYIPDNTYTALWVDNNHDKNDLKENKLYCIACISKITKESLSKIIVYAMSNNQKIELIN